MLIQLAITGLLAALLPLAMVWVSADANKYRKLIWVVLFLTFDLIVFGSFTRLSEAGLGCPDWPGCYGHGSPVGAVAHIELAQGDGLLHHPDAILHLVLEGTRRRLVKRHRTIQRLLPREQLRLRLGRNAFAPGSVQRYRDHRTTGDRRY